MATFQEKIARLEVAVENERLQFVEVATRLLDGIKELEEKLGDGIVITQADLDKLDALAESVVGIVDPTVGVPTEEPDLDDEDGDDEEVTPVEPEPIEDEDIL